jgi:hypothetical protein
VLRQVGKQKSISCETWCEPDIAGNKVDEIKLLIKERVKENLDKVNKMLDAFNSRDEYYRNSN